MAELHQSIKQLERGKVVIKRIDGLEEMAELNIIFTEKSFIEAF